MRPPGVTAREWTRLGVMSVLFVIAVGVMLALHFTRKSPKAPLKEVPKKTAGTDVPDDPPRKDAPPPAQNLEEKAAETLRTLRDGPEPVRKDQPEFLDFLYLMLAAKPDDVAGKVTPGTGPRELLGDPRSNRGKYLRLHGRLIQLYTEKMPVTTTTGTDLVYLGILQSWPDNLTVAFYLPEFPRDAEGKDLKFKSKQYQGETILEDWVEIEGMFLRVLEYEGNAAGQAKGPTVKAPLLFAKTIRQKPPPKMADPKKDFAWLVLGVAVVVVGIVIFAGVVTRKRDRKSLRMEMAGIKLEKARKEGKSLFPAPNPVVGDPSSGENPPKPPA